MAKAQTLPSVYPDLEDDDQDLPLVPQSAQAPQSLTSLLPTVGVPTDSKLPASLNGNGISGLPSLSSVAADKDQQSAVGQVMDQSKPAGALPGVGADVPAMDPNTGDYTRIQHLNTILPTADESLGKGPMSVLPPVSQPTVTSRQEQMAENQEDRLERDQNRLDQLNTPWDKSAHGFFGNLGHALGQSTAGTRAGNAARLAGAEDAVKNDATVLDQMRATQDAQKKTDYAQTNYQQGQAGRDAETNEKNADAYDKLHPQPKEGELPLGQSSDNLNGANLKRLQVLDPTIKELPKEYQLNAQSTQKDFDRVDKVLEGTEKARGTLAQQQATNALREQSMAMVQAARETAAGNQSNNRTDKAVDNYQKPFDAQVKDANAQLEKINAAENDIQGNAESQAVGIPKVLTALVSGAGTGVRITQAELTNIGHARGIGGDVVGTLRQWEGKGVLTKTQQAQLVGILEDAKARIAEKQRISQAASQAISTSHSREEVLKNKQDYEDQYNHYEANDEIKVQIPGQTASYIRRDQKNNFMKKYPDGQVL
jgi:hypothetical protein